MVWTKSRRVALAASSAVSALLVASMAFSYLSANADPHVSEVERRFGVHVLARMDQQDAKVSPMWASGGYVPITRVLEPSGYSLAGLSGQQITLTEYLIFERHDGWPVSVVLITQDDRLIGGYAHTVPSALAADGNGLPLSELAAAR